MKPRSRPARPCARPRTARRSTCQNNAGRWPPPWGSAPSSWRRRTEPNGSVSGAPCPRLAPPVKGEDEGEDPARGSEIQDQLAVQALHQQLGRLVVQAPPAHVEIGRASCRERV